MHLDFETYSEIDLPAVGAFRYAEDPSTEVLCVSFSNGKGIPEIVNLQAEDMNSPKLRPLFDAVHRGERLIAHNAHFERAIWEKVCLRHGWPKPKATQWKCTAAKASAAAYPRSLQNAAIALKLTVNKDPSGLALIRKFCKPDKKGHRTTYQEQPTEFEALLRYCQQDTIVEHAIDQALPDLIPSEEVIFRLDYLINNRGIPVDVALAKRTLEIRDELTHALELEAMEMTGLKVTQRDKLLDWLDAAGAGMETLQANEVEAAIADPNLDPRIRRLLEVRIEATRAGMKKLNAIIAGASADGRIRGAFMYHAASPGRWGSTGAQFHNLPKGSAELQDVTLGLLEHPEARVLLPIWFERPLTAISQSMRGFLAAPPGRELMVADYSAIEARVLAWIADEEFILRQYRGAGKVYEAMAANIFNVPASQVTKDQRFVGKQAVLGCGYQLGWQKFIVQCAKYGVTINEEFARKTITAYRESVPAIVRFWTDIENAALRCVHTGKEQAIARGRVRFRMHGASLQMVLPSGRPTSYPEAHILSVEKFGRQKLVLHFSSVWKNTWVVEQTYGGKLTENLVQAASRDLLAEGLLQAERNGYPVIGHVHDETQSEVDEGFGSVSDYERLICTLPPWATGLPLAAEGYRAKRYRK